MPTRSLTTALALALVLPLTAAAQNGAVISSLGQLHDLTKGHIVQTAEMVSEELYGFRPTDEVRTLGQMLAHIADGQYLFCSVAAGEENPNSENLEETRTTKAEITEALSEAFGYCDRVYASMSDAEGSAMRNLFGREMAAAAVLAFNTTHNYQHYGSLVTYMRINGIVPPSSM